MRSEYKFIFASLILLCLVVSMGAAYADDLDTVQEGEVSGGVDVAYSNPGAENGELSYDIPEDVQNVQYAGLFVDCYTAGSSNTVYGSEANVSVTSNGETEQIANEMLVSTQGSQDGTVYTINDHTTKCYADYYMTYNLTEKLQGVSGKVTFNVNTGALEGYEYYNKIKLIGLVFAYNDGDSDKICYWVNSGSSWIKGDSTDTSKATFDVGTISCEISKATLDNFALSSIDGLYSFNGKELEESTAYDEGVYYFKYHQWDVLDKFTNATNTLVYAPGEGAFSFRNTLSVLTVTKHTPAVSVKLGSEYNGAVFAGTNNVLQLNLTNKGESDTVYIVDFYVDGVKVNSTEIQLDEGLSSSTYLIDDLIRPVTADTVNGVSTTKVNYTVIVSDKDTGEILNQSTITPTLWYNGNLGKDLAYPAESIVSFDNITVNGDVIIDTQGDSTYMGATATNRTDVWTLDVPEDAQFVNGFIYVSYNWDKTGQTVPPFTATFNGVAVTPVATYRDQSNMGSYGKYGYGLIVYDVSGLLQKGENTFVLEKEFNKTAVYPSTLVAFYNVSKSSTEKTIYMYNGADLLSNANNFLGRIVASNNVLGIGSIDNIVGSSLYVFAASAQAGEGSLIVNDASYDNVWSGSSNSVGQYIVDLGTAPSESNTVSFVATGSTILALEQFIVVEYNVPSASAKIGSEYNGAVFAGTDNVIQVNVTNDGVIKSTYVIDLYADGVKVNSTEIELDVGASGTFYLRDEAIRPVTAETVNGVSTTKVNYTVVISDGNGKVISESTLTPTLWYNGNLGKDLAYPAETITSFDNITVNGDVIIDTKEDSTYCAAGSSGRTDVWTLDVPGDASFVNGFVYVAYNWDKTNGTIPVWTTTFNGVEISPVASYRDQSNMGTYGKYGYGLVVYDVSSLLQKGENTFVLVKEINKTAVYPSTLVALYNVPGSDTIKTVYMYNGADLLSNANNFLGRIVASNNVLGADLVEDILGADLHVFAASAQAGEGNLIVNDKIYENVWSGSSNSVSDYVIDLKDSLKGSNAVSFVATGSTILALQQFIVVEASIPKASDLQKLIDETPIGGVLNLNSVYANVSGININKDISIVGDNAFIFTAGDGNPVFSIAAGVNNVSISGINFVANNGDVLIKAIATNGTDDLSIVNPAIEIANNTVAKANDNVVASSITLFELESERGVLAPSNPIDINDNNVVDGAKTFDFEIVGLNDGSGINIPQGGSINTNGSSSVVKVATNIVAKAMTTTTVNTKINGKNAGKNFSITLKDSKGNVLANKQVMISLNGKIYKRTTNANGVATVKIALSKKGTYPVVISFLGDDKYNGSFVVTKVKVNPQKVKLTVTKKTYKASKKTKYLYATLKATNKKAIKGKKLVFTVNGKKYTAKTNAKGIAKVKVNLSKKKTYKVTVKFAGDSTFNKITKKGKVVIK
ncbi:MAG: DUF3344 domain-containing protein [Methanobrevibacter sp.]|nr:DUF3344 domain-containing protein [Methanobrevibacter sp.]